MLNKRVLLSTITVCLLASCNNNPTVVSTNTTKLDVQSVQKINSSALNISSRSGKISVNRSSAPLQVYNEPSKLLKKDVNIDNSVKPEKIDPRLLKKVKDRGNSKDLENVLIVFKSESPNFAKQTSTDGKFDVEQMNNLRRSESGEIESRLNILGGKVLEHFWITPSVLVEIPLNAIQSIAKLSQIEYIIPQITGETPPAYGDTITGRTIMHSDFLQNMSNPPRTRIGLIDGHLWKGHALLQDADIRYFDCTIVDCPLTTPPGANINYRHSTADASILSGTGALGPDSRGVTSHPIDAYNIYNIGLQNGLTVELSDIAAYNRSWQKISTNNNKVVIVETQGCPTGSSVEAMNSPARIYAQQGNVVIAAAGNYGNGNTDQYAANCGSVPSSTYIGTPAQDKSVIAVGAVDYSSLATRSYQSRDNRYNYIKPDVQGPDCLRVAYATSVNELNTFCGTSGSTPFVGGLSSLMYSLDNSITAQMVHAWLIASGRNQGSPYTDGMGAGVSDLLYNSNQDTDTTIGDTQMGSTGSVTEVALTSLNRSYQRVRASIYWNDDNTTHDDIDLDLVAPNGQIYSSLSGPAVWEKATSSPSIAGTWKLRIKTFSRPSCQGLCLLKNISYTVIGDL